MAAVARAREVRDLADLIGEAALTETERRYLSFADVFTSVLVDQRSDEARSLDDTLSRMWQVLSALPRRELTMIAAADIAAYYSGDESAPAADPSTPSRPESSGTPEPSPTAPVDGGTDDG